jgi:hypothetical protein
VFAAESACGLVRASATVGTVETVPACDSQRIVSSAFSPSRIPFPLSSVAQHIPAATAAADPDEEPPGMYSSFHGFRAGPKKLSRPVVLFVLPTTIAPAAFRYATATASCAGTRSLKCSKAAVVLILAVS